jgi:hypothetical protein
VSKTCDKCEEALLCKGEDGGVEDRQIVEIGKAKREQVGGEDCGD